jgi:hypothetical protein
MTYRYATAALIGPWRTSRQAAERDALAAGQALRVSNGRIAMRDIATIEVRHNAAGDARLTCQSRQATQRLSD